MLPSRLVHSVVVVALLATPLFLFGHRAHALQDAEDKVAFGPLRRRRPPGSARQCLRDR